MLIQAPASNSRVLALRSPLTPLTGTAAETSMARVPIPGGAMGLWGLLRVTHWWSYTNSVNDKLPRLRLGGDAGVIFGAPVHTTTVQSHQQHSIANVGAANVQEYFLASNTTGFSATTGAVAAAAAINTAVDQELVITAQLEDPADTMILRRYLVELLLP